MSFLVEFYKNRKVAMFLNVIFFDVCDLFHEIQNGNK